MISPDWTSDSPSPDRPFCVLRKVSRGINLDVVLGNLDSEVRFAVLQNDIVPNGVAIHGRYERGTSVV
jgi:hypothetical protein